MMVVLPKSKSPEALISCATHEFQLQRLIELQAQMTSVEVALQLPRFRIEFASSLKEVLSRLGAADAFTPNAHFSRMVKEAGEPNKPKVYIDDVLHQAVLSVDENGVEAAAATVVRMRMLMASIRPMTIPVSMIVNRPFAVALFDEETHSVFFSGLIQNP